MTGRWRALSNREVGLIEEGYQRYMRELQVDKETFYRVSLEPKFEVCFYYPLIIFRRFMKKFLEHLLGYQ